MGCTNSDSGPKKNGSFFCCWRLKIGGIPTKKTKQMGCFSFGGGEVGGVSWRGSKHKKSFCVCFSKKSRVEKRDVNLISSHPPAVDDPEVFYLQDTSSRLFLFVFASSDFLFLSFLKFFSFKNSWESSRCVNDEMHTFLILYVAQFAKFLYLVHLIKQLHFFPYFFCVSLRMFCCLDSIMRETPNSDIFPLH